MPRDAVRSWDEATHPLLHAADSLASPPKGGELTKWLLGVALPMLPIAYGLYCLWNGATVLPGKGLDATLTGAAGRWLAVAYMALGAFIHFHFGWGLSKRGARFSRVAKACALVLFLVSFGLALAGWLR